MTLTSQIEAASGARKKSLTKNKSFRQKKKNNSVESTKEEVPVPKKETKNQKPSKSSKKKESKVEKKEVIEEDVKSEEEEFGIRRTSSLKRGLGWIRRSFSFSKGLDYDPLTWRKKKTSWSASLTSLPEGVADNGTASAVQHHFHERKGVSRTQSLLMPSSRTMDTFPYQDLSGGLGQRTVSHQGGLHSSYHFSCYDQIDFSDYVSHSVHSLPSLVHQPHDFSSSRFRRLFSEELGVARRPKYGGGGNGTGAGTRLRRQAAFKNSENSLFATSSSTKVGGTTSRRRGSACSGAGSRDVSPSGGDAAEASQHHGGNTSWASSQDWRRLVGSIRRRVRGRSTTSVAAPVPADATSATDSGGTMPAFMTSSDPTVRDDFLRATMRIFLVVSPPMGRLQGRSRSLTHLDCLDPADVRLDEVEPPLLVAAGTSDSLTAPMEQENRLIVPSTEPHHTRRKKLARSQVSSSEYFSVSFECGGSPGEDSSTLPNEEFIPATKGTALGDALRAVCTRRGLDLNNLEVFLESSRTPLPIVTDTSWLGGKHVRLRVRDDKSPVRGLKANQVPLRKASGSYRGKGGRFFSASTEDPNYIATADSSHEGSIKGSSKASSKQRWSGLFGNSKDTKMESLVDQLNSYSKHGIPRLQNTDDSDSDESVYELEEDWQDVVTVAGELSERARQQQTAIWELLSTEVAYIKTLKVVTDLFLACLCSLQAANILNEVDKAKLFSNIPDIYAANCHFWCNYLLPMLTESRKTGQPLNPQLLLEGFRRFQDIFLPYTKYCAEQSQCQQYCRERHQENDVFTAYLVWCETQKECNRLRLMDIVVKPMQRLTKYSLLLKAIHKNTENEEQRESLILMIKCVDQFVNDVNSTLRQRQDHERLKGIIARIESYDVVETKDDEVERILKLHSELDLTCPMPGCHVTQRRYLLLESDLKLKDNSTSKMDVHCFLLTDMLLVCKPITKKGGSGSVRIVRQPYLVDRLVVQELARDPPSIALVYLNEFQTATAAFIFYSQEQKLIKNWVEGIKKAQDLYTAAKNASNIAQPSHLNTSSPAVPLASISRQPSACFYEDEDSLLLETDYQSCASYSAGLLPSSRSPRGGSSRGSRGSSLMHSHSGSVDMNEASSVSSVSQSRGVSMENELRGSSLSSDEGIPVASCSCDSSKSANQITQQPVPLPSPRPERRSQLSKSPSPNTLSVQVPVFSSLGQSLPNLNLATSPSSGHATASPPNPPSSLLLVPPAGNKTQHHGGLLSPGHRGISYPPPSPPRGSLRRGFALTQTRNPPLLKTRHINSTIVTPNIPSPTNSQCASLTASYDFDVPVITGVSPPREGRMTPEPPEVAGAGPIRSHPHRHPMMKRLTRTDNRRYHTAGAIDDIKKQDSRDASIHKRLSWNCGQQQQQQQQHQQEVGMNSASNTDLAKKCMSSESVQSSSGVSSTGSAQYGGELDLLELDGPASGLMCSNTLDCCLDPTSIRDGKNEAGLPLSPAMEAINMELLRSRLSPLPLDLESSQSQSKDDEVQQKDNENKAELLRMKDLILTQGEASKV